MAGGIINIASYGAQDIFLTGTPQITFFKIIYRRYTNFSFESIELPFDNNNCSGFGAKMELLLPTIGDLVNKMYLKIKLPKLCVERDLTDSCNKITSLKSQYDSILLEFEKFTLFINVNMRAYRAIREISLAENSNVFQMVNAVTAIFASYTRPVGKMATCVNYYENYSPLKYYPPQSFNLNLIVKNKKYERDDFLRIVQNAIDNSKRVHQYYEDELINLKSQIDDAQSPYFKIAWVDKIGHSIIEYIDITIGSDRIDRQYGDWLNIWYELTSSVYQDYIYNKMIGNVPELTCFNRCPKDPYPLYVPLQFWFNRFNGLALPLIALQYNEVTISVKFRQLNDCAYIEDLRKYTDRNYRNSVNLQDVISGRLEVSLLTDYVYLDGPERRRFAQVSHEYLMDQLQVIEQKNIISKNVGGDCISNICCDNQKYCSNKTCTTCPVKLCKMNCDVLPSYSLPVCGSCNTGYGYGSLSSLSPTANFCSCSVCLPCGPEYMEPSTYCSGYYGYYPRNYCNKICLRNKHDDYKFCCSHVPLIPVCGDYCDPFIIKIPTCDVGYSPYDNPCSDFIVPRRYCSVTPVQIQLDFYDPCRELIWVIQKQAYTCNPTGFNKCRWDNYSLTNVGCGIPMQSANINFGGYTLLEEKQGPYFNYVQPYEHHRRTPSDGIYVYSFALKPEENQPTGTANFTRIKTGYLNLTIKDDMFFYLSDEGWKETCVNIRVYATNINVLRFMSGFAGLAYV